MGWSTFFSVLGLVYLLYYAILILRDLMAAQRGTRAAAAPDVFTFTSAPPVRVVPDLPAAPLPPPPAADDSATAPVRFPGFQIDLAYERASYSGGIWVSDILSQKIPA